MRWMNWTCWRRLRFSDFRSLAWYKLMRMRFPVAAALLAVSACMALFAPGVYAQKASEGGKPPPAQRKPPPPPQWKPPKHPKQPPPNPAVELRQFLSMKPEQREKELAKLPPQRQARMQDQISKFESLPPEKREQQLQRLQAMFNLPPERRQAVNQEIQRIRQFQPGAERRQQLMSEEFQQKFSPEEKELIYDQFPGARPRE